MELDPTSQIINIVKTSERTHDVVAAPWDPLTSQLANGLEMKVWVTGRVIIDDRYVVALISYSRNDFGRRWNLNEPWNDSMTYMWLLVQIDSVTKEVQTRHVPEIGSILLYETKCCKKQYAIAFLEYYGTMYLFDCRVTYLGHIMEPDDLNGWLGCCDKCDEDHLPNWETSSGIHRWIRSNNPGDEMK